MYESVTYYCGFSLSDNGERLIYCLETTDRGLTNLRGVFYNLTEHTGDKSDLMVEIMRDCAKLSLAELNDVDHLVLNLVVDKKYLQICRDAADFINLTSKDLSINIITEPTNCRRCEAIVIKNRCGAQSQEYKKFKESVALETGKKVWC